MKVVIWSHFISPRLEFIAQWLENRWSIPVIINQELPAQGNIIINYGPNHRDEFTLSMPDCGLLSQTGISSTDIKPDLTDIYTKLFHIKDKELDIDFDFFSMVFYLLSRYEEYEFHETDEHGRWISGQSAALKLGFIQEPIIDLWLIYIEGLIESKTKHRFDRRHGIKHVPTIDIDIPYAYKNKEWRNLAGLARDFIRGDQTKVNARLSYLRNRSDPYDTYDYLLKCLKSFPESTFFFLCNYQKPYDENHLIGTDEFNQLVKRITQSHHIGIHPSYSSNSTTSTITEETQILALITGQHITRSRQHFLKMSMPQTYQTLIAAGLTEDHSMMYADRIGFRASTCHPFLWYDLSQEKTTDLTIHSPCLMDVTLKNYLNLNPEESLIVIDKLKKTIANVNGTLEFIWHNSSFSAAHGWDGWQKTFEYLLKA